MDLNKPRKNQGLVSAPVELVREAFSDGWEVTKAGAALAGDCAVFLGKQLYVMSKPIVAVSTVGTALYYGAGSLGTVATGATGAAALGAGVGVAALGVVSAGAAIVGGLVGLGVTVKLCKALWGVGSGACRMTTELVRDARDFCAGVRAGTKKFFEGFRETTLKTAEEKLDRREGFEVALTGTRVLNFWRGVASRNRDKNGVTELIEEIEGKVRGVDSQHGLVENLTEAVRKRAKEAVQKGEIPIRDVSKQINRCLADINRDLTSGLLGKIEQAVDLDEAEAAVGEAFEAAIDKIQTLEIKKIERRKRAAGGGGALRVEDGISIDVRAGGGDYSEDGLIVVESGEDSGGINVGGEPRLSIEKSQFEKVAADLNEGAAEGQETFTVEEVEIGGERSFQLIGDQGNSFVYAEDKVVHYKGNTKQSQSWEVSYLGKLASVLTTAVRAIKAEGPFKQLQSDLAAMFNQDDYKLTLTETGEIFCSFPSGRRGYFWYEPSDNGGPFALSGESLQPSFRGSEAEVLAEFKKKCERWHISTVAEKVSRDIGSLLEGDDRFEVGLEQDVLVFNNKKGGEVRLERTSGSQIRLQSKGGGTVTIKDTNMKDLEAELRVAFRNALPQQKTLEEAKDGVKSALAELFLEEDYSVQDGNADFTVRVGQGSVTVRYDQEKRLWACKIRTVDGKDGAYNFLTADSATEALKVYAASFYRNAIFDEIAGEVNERLEDHKKFAKLRGGIGAGWALTNKEDNEVGYSLVSGDVGRLVLLSRLEDGGVARIPSDLKSLRENLRQAIRKTLETTEQSEQGRALSGLELNSQLSDILNPNDYQLTDRGNGSVDCVVGAARIRLESDGQDTFCVSSGRNDPKAADFAGSIPVSRHGNLSPDQAVAKFKDEVEATYVLHVFADVAEKVNGRKGSGTLIIGSSPDEAPPRFKAALKHAETTIYYDGSSVVVTKGKSDSTRKFCGTFGLRSEIDRVVGELFQQPEEQNGPAADGQSSNPANQEVQQRRTRRVRRQ